MVQLNTCGDPGVSSTRETTTPTNVHPAQLIRLPPSRIAARTSDAVTESLPGSV